ncbi:hypothetical protein DXG01_016285, partial [Tephrocybe rancida]
TLIFDAEIKDAIAYGEFTPSSRKLTFSMNRSSLIPLTRMLRARAAGSGSISALRKVTAVLLDPPRHHIAEDDIVALNKEFGTFFNVLYGLDVTHNLGTHAVGSTDASTSFLERDSTYGKFSERLLWS